MHDKFFVKPTQTINVGQVSITGGSAAKIVSANTSRRKITIASADLGNTWLGTSSGVTNSNGYPMYLGSHLTTDFGESGAITLDWQSDVWVYAGGSNLTVYYIEELLS
jgi:hypothetical protein